MLKGYQLVLQTHELFDKCLSKLSEPDIVHQVQENSNYLSSI